MGCCPCFGSKKKEYTPIPDKERVVDVRVSPVVITDRHSNSDSSSHRSAANKMFAQVEVINKVLPVEVEPPRRTRTPPSSKPAVTEVTLKHLVKVAPVNQSKPPSPPPKLHEEYVEILPQSQWTEEHVVAAKPPSPAPPVPASSALVVEPPHPVTPNSNHTSTPMSVSPSPADTPISSKPYDENLSVYKGTLVDQKFSNKSSYETKFAWINYENKSLNLSEHMTKERRHKEASLIDVIIVVRGAPEKFKSSGTTPAGGVPVFHEAHLCLSVKFVRGGGIDLKFKTETDRDLWFEQISRIIATNKK